MKPQPPGPPGLCTSGRSVPLDAEELVNGLRRLQVVDAAVLEKELLSGVLLRRVTFVVRVFGVAR